MTKRGRGMLRALARGLRRVGARMGIVLLFAATAFVMTWLNSRVIAPGQATGSASLPGAGLTVRTEAAHIWLPVTLIDLARERRESLVTITHAQLQKLLKHRQQQHLWYALTFHAHQADHGVTDITYIRRPHRDVEHFAELLEILAVAAGKRSESPSGRFDNVQVHVLSCEQSELAPRKVVEELLRQEATSSELHAN